jgi:hypothetical protein
MHYCIIISYRRICITIQTNKFKTLKQTSASQTEYSTVQSREERLSESNTAGICTAQVGIRR